MPNVLSLPLQLFPGISFKVVLTKVGIYLFVKKARGVGEISFTHWNVTTIRD